MRHLLLALSCGFLLSACVSLPENYERQESYKLDGDDTRIARVIQADLEAHPGQSAVHPLGNGLEALAARVVLARAAERSLDVQYYIWHADEAGLLLLGELMKAADRGVRVRLLLDDVGVGATDDEAFLALDAHPNVSLRLFNPIALRKSRTLGMIANPLRLNQRMHNKSMTADNLLTVVGGRNIGNEYFTLDELVNFADMDVLALGPAVDAVSDSFDAYWNSPAAYPLNAFHPAPGSPEELAAIRGRLDDWLAKHTGPLYESLRNTDFDIETGPRDISLYWGQVTALADDPAKVLGESPERLVDRLGNLLGKVGTDLLIVSPYFVPGKQGTALLVSVAQRGATVRVATNSLAATDVGAVHAGYKKSRRDLLEGGVELFEMMPAPGVEANRESSLIGSSGASLHAKMFVIDRERVFVGSMNLDPRSIDLNTEIGLLIDSPELARYLANGIEDRLGDTFYRVVLEPRDPARPDGRQRLVWLEQGDGETRRYLDEPQTTAWQRFIVNFISIFPIDSQL